MSWAPQSVHAKLAKPKRPLKWSYRRFKLKEQGGAAQSPGYKTGLTAVGAFLLFARASRLPTEVNPWRSPAKKFPHANFSPHTKKIEHGTGGSGCEAEGAKNNLPDNHQGARTSRNATPHSLVLSCSLLPLYRSISRGTPCGPRSRCQFKVRRPALSPDKSPSIEPISLKPFFRKDIPNEIPTLCLESATNERSDTGKPFRKSERRVHCRKLTKIAWNDLLFTHWLIH